MPDWLPGNLPQTVAEAAIRIVFLLLIAVIALVLVRWLITRVVRRAIREPHRSRFALTADAPDGERTPERRRQRLLALGSLIKSILTVIICVIVVIMVLSILGFNIATLLAGTSIVGLALAFGLQSVIKDLVSGVFMLAEDQFGVGDVVDMLPGTSGGGTVESVGLRVTRLRLEDGTATYIRNGEITRVLNYSQGGPGRLPDPEDA